MLRIFPMNFRMKIITIRNIHEDSCVSRKRHTTVFQFPSHSKVRDSQVENPDFTKSLRDLNSSCLSMMYVSTFQVTFHSNMSLVIFDFITNGYRNEVSTNVTKLLLVFSEERSLIRYSSCGRLGTTRRHGIL